MKVIWDYLSEVDKGYLLAQIPSRVLREEYTLRAQLNVDEDLEEDEEEEFEFQSKDEKEWAISKLYGKYPYEIACLVFRGRQKFPKWLKEEILERRKRVPVDESKVKVRCKLCHWEGTLNECGFGHDDFICSKCGTETIEEVMPY